MDLEQLQLEKAGLVIKLAGRDHELAKFLHKRREVVQVKPMSIYNPDVQIWHST